MSKEAFMAKLKIHDFYRRSKEEHDPRSFQTLNGLGESCDGEDFFLSDLKLS
jgi:hypothetical protein